MLLNCGVEKTRKSPLDSKEIQPVNPDGNQSWIFIGRTNAEPETQHFGTWCKELTHLKRPWCWERLRAGREGDNRGWDGWMVSPTRWTWVWVISGVGDGRGGLACCSPWGGKELDTSEWLNWTELCHLESPLMLPITRTIAQILTKTFERLPPSMKNKTNKQKKNPYILNYKVLTTLFCMLWESLSFFGQRYVMPRNGKGRTLTFQNRSVLSSSPPLP